MSDGEQALEVSSGEESVVWCQWCMSMRECRTRMNVWMGDARVCVVGEERRMGDVDGSRREREAKCRTAREMVTIAVQDWIALPCSIYECTSGRDSMPNAHRQRWHGGCGNNLTHRHNRHNFA